MIRAVTASAARPSASSKSSANSSPPKRATVSSGPHAGRQALGHAGEQHVAGRVAERVVDRLEVVEVEEGDRQRPLVSGRRASACVDPIDEQGAVGEPGQGVVPGPGRQLGFEGDPLAHVAAC